MLRNPLLRAILAAALLFAPFLAPQPSAATPAITLIDPYVVQVEDLSANGTLTFETQYLGYRSVAIKYHCRTNGGSGFGGGTMSVTASIDGGVYLPALDAKDKSITFTADSSGDLKGGGWGAVVRYRFTLAGATAPGVRCTVTLELDGVMQ